MPSKSPTPPRRVGDYAPLVATGELLDEIEGVEVTIAVISQHDRTGRSGAYVLTVITLDDGRIFHTGSPVIAEALSAIPEQDYPVVGTFARQRSASNPQQSYWTVR
jgi:hypothetical protein